jgi:hypothetical protein
MKVWVITEDTIKTGKILETTLLHEENGDIVIPSVNFPGARSEIPKGFWHKTKDAALSHAKKMREKKIFYLRSNIATIEEEIERLEGMIFE